MSDNVLYDIIQLCYDLDRYSFEAYRLISQNCTNKEFCKFWLEMAKEEKLHLQFWGKILPLAREGIIPQIFSKPYSLKEELENIKIKAGFLTEECKSTLDVNKAFLITYRMEFFLLHPALEYFFIFATELENFIGIRITEQDYEEHINKIYRSLISYGEISMEMELLGELIERLWRENRKLIKQKNTDVLTNILNRRGFFEIVRPLAYFCQRNNYQVGVLMCDIDHFKKINDKYGHQIGDEIIQDVAAIIKESIRESDLCGRYGGEEFVVFLSNISKESVLKISEKIRKSVENLPREINITISIGAYIGEIKLPVEKSFEILLKEADKLLYISKEKGRNQIVSNYQD